MKYILLFALILTISCDNASTIWNFLVNYVTKEGAGGIMGNLYAESALNPAVYETSKHSKIGLSNDEYVRRVNSGQYTRSQFMNDGAGFGIAQWTYYTRKAALYDNCKGQIANLNCQLKYLVQELKSDFAKLWSYLKSSHDLKECSTRVLKDFERPANADGKINQRYQYSLNYYNKFK